MKTTVFVHTDTDKFGLYTQRESCEADVLADIEVELLPRLSPSSGLVDTGAGISSCSGPEVESLRSYRHLRRSTSHAASFSLMFGVARTSACIELYSV